MITTEHPLRYPLQAIVSLGQLYGDVLYYATALFDYFLVNLSYSRPEAYYFWAYFVLMNAFWIVIPLSKHRCFQLHRIYGLTCTSLARGKRPRVQQSIHSTGEDGKVP